MSIDLIIDHRCCAFKNFTYFVVEFVVAISDIGQKSVSKTESSGLEALSNACIDFGVVTMVEAFFGWCQTVFLYGVRSDDHWQPLVDDNMLNLSYDDMACLLESCLIIPVRILFLENFCHLIVFTHPKRVHDGQRKLLVDPFVPGVETVKIPGPRHTSYVGFSRLHWEKIFQSEILIEFRTLQEAVLVGPEPGSNFLIRSVEETGVDIR